jgi:hypothetical protein
LLFVAGASFSMAFASLIRLLRIVLRVLPLALPLKTGMI